MFLTFEGSEGCGKTTQIGLLRARLEEGGREVLVTREPGGTFVGEEIRKLLQYTPEAAGMCDEAELLLFGASRAQLVREVVAPALRRGCVVIADRFLDSTTVYQGGARGLGRAAVDAVNRMAVGDCRPHLTLLLDLDAEAGRRRAAARGGVDDRMEQQPAEFYRKVRDGYLALAGEEPGRIQVIDASAPVGEVAEQVWQVVSARAGWVA